MKKLLIAALVSAGMFLASAAAHATVIDFDDLNANGTRSSMSTRTPYAGFNWTSSWHLGVDTVAGYDNASHSGGNFLLNGFGVPNLGVSSTAAFDFAGAWFAVPNITGSKASWINITAYDAANQLIGTTGNMAITGSFVYIAANFADVSRLNITRDKGWFVMDDFTLTDAEVPEPGTLLMFGMGMAVLAAARRKKA